MSCTNGIGLSALCARTFDVPRLEDAASGFDEIDGRAAEPTLAQLLSRTEELTTSLTTDGADTRGRAELLSVLRDARKLERAR